MLRLIHAFASTNSAEPRLSEADDAKALAAIRETIAKLDGIETVHTNPVLADHLS